MSLHHARPGEPIDIRPLGPSLRDTPSKALVRSDQIEVLRLTMMAGETRPPHEISASAITLQCLEGVVEVTAYGVTQSLGEGTLMFLAAGVPHSLRAITDTSVLVTLFLNRAPLPEATLAPGA